MKPPKFEYESPHSVDEVVAILDKYKKNAKILAGGQSLIAALNFRSIQPDVIIDINKISLLEYVEKTQDDNILIGALTRQGMLEHNEVIKENLPLMYQAIPYVAHTAIRNRGSIGGSIVYADPAGEQPTITTALDASFKLESVNGVRWVLAEDFFLAMNKTVIEPNEILTEIKIPIMNPTVGWAFEEVSRRHGDRVMMGVAALVIIDEKGKCEKVRLVYQNGAVKPVLGVKAGHFLHGVSVDQADKAISEAAQIAAYDEINPVGDVHTSPEFQRSLAKELTIRVLKKAFSDAVAKQK